ncbi:MmgE/PrpD family protein [Microvirga sp. G4-2]|uniref:MmgE/PrpD family protein n=1 Tax=Microvirga sp. G4-2 TaxID=3434467 RepID=UPI004044D57A
MNDINQLAQISLAARLAEKIRSFNKQQVTKKALQQAKTCFLDTVGVTLAGIPEDCTQILLRTPGVAEAPGSSLIFGTDRRTSALDAALINGTASHALDYDDFNSVFGGHHSVPLVAALLAVAEERKYSGEEVLLAYIVGVETELKLARAVHFHHYDKGWHPTATLGTFGAAAAMSYLIGLDQQKTTMALAIAASLASGIKANFGTMTKPLHVGQCGRNGLLAALLAENGFDANPSVLEHHQGFLNVFNGPGTFDAEKLFAGWAEPLEIESSDVGLKQFPCCGSTHPAIMMMLNLVREEGITADDVTRLEVLPHGRRLRHTNTPHPKTPVEAKFSVQYVVARALLDGAVRLKDFEGEAHNEPTIRRLLQITEARPHPDMADDAAEQWGAEVIVELKDGRMLSRRVDNLVGRGGDNPMSSDELWEKFEDCASRSLPREQIAPLFERLETLESVADIGQLTRLLQVSSLRGARKVEAPVSFANRTEQEAPETTWVP